MAKNAETPSINTGNTTMAKTQIVLPAGPEKIPIRAMPERMRADTAVIALSGDPHGAANLDFASIVFSMLSAHMVKQMPHTGIHHIKNQSLA